MTEKELKKRLREIPLPERIKACKKMIGRMCREGKPPKMTIPVQWDDEDFYIVNTLKDIEEELKGD